ncbi:MAG: hypothetical protein EP298_02235 [Gammaproteobacteria bacterium]|nr:MAG: hypothetical protein EP298_02235 [Gammaproteobacteria bacterium]UTW43625.1 hypothetical protein KFE69_05920 [bacterium SCSIO 12844]
MSNTLEMSSEVIGLVKNGAINIYVAFLLYLVPVIYFFINNYFGYVLKFKSNMVVKGLPKYYKHYMKTINQIESSVGFSNYEKEKLKRIVQYEFQAKTYGKIPLSIFGYKKLDHMISINRIKISLIKVLQGYYKIDWSNYKLIVDKRSAYKWGYSFFILAIIAGGVNIFLSQHIHYDSRLIDKLCFVILYIAFIALLYLSVRQLQAVKKVPIILSKIKFSRRDFLEYDISYLR